MAAGREGMTRCFEPSSYLLDAEEVRGSNPLAPTKCAGQRPFLSAAGLFLSAEERLSRNQRCKAAGQTVCGSCRSRAQYRSGGEEVDGKLTPGVAVPAPGSKGGPSIGRKVA
jgi:hypothetical protein